MFWYFLHTNVSVKQCSFCCPIYAKAVMVVVVVGFGLLIGAVQSRSMDQSKDFGVFGYGSVAWKERVESWKIRQDKNSMMMTEGHQHHLSGKGVDLDDGSGAGQGSDLPM
jgi:hypothetical protein